MIRLFVATIFLGWLVLPATAAGLDAAAINNAEFRSKPAAEDKTDPAVVKAQVLLDRAQFSPGEIDGKLGENAQKALRAFAEAKGLPSDKALTPEIWTALVGTSQDPVIAEYKISESDVKGPFLEKLPARMDDMKSLKALSYTSPREAIAEKFHMSEGLLSALNPGKKFDRAGETIFVANVLNKPPKLTIGRIEDRQVASDGEGVRPIRRADRLFSGDRRQRGKTNSKRHSQGRLRRCQPDLSLQSRL